jgi:predicted transcriptional regulator
MSTVTEVESALEKFTPAQMQEVADWLSARLIPEETPEMLAAIDEGLRSLETEPTLSGEDVRQNIRAWVTK